jgi:hypothetical protein
MLYMVIEHFHDGAGPEVYRRFREKGRMMPDGLSYVASWIEPDFRRCFQMMEWDDPAVFAEWTAKWGDLMTFETIPVITSADAQTIMRDRSQDPSALG